MNEKVTRVSEIEPGWPRGAWTKKGLEPLDSNMSANIYSYMSVNTTKK